MKSQLILIKQKKKHFVSKNILLMQQKFCFHKSDVPDVSRPCFISPSAGHISRWEVCDGDLVAAGGGGTVCICQWATCCPREARLSGECQDWHAGCNRWDELCLYLSSFSCFTNPFHKFPFFHYFPVMIDSLSVIGRVGLFVLICCIFYGVKHDFVDWKKKKL